MYILLVILQVSTVSVCGFTFTAFKRTSEDLFIHLSCTIILNMEKVNFQQSLKNIPAPDDKLYLELLIMSMDKTIKDLRNKAIHFLKKKNSKKKETFGLKSIRNPDAVPELKAFEKDLTNLALNIKFRHFDNRLQKNLRSLCKSIKDEPKLIIPSDKTSNFYKLPINMYKKLRNQDVQKNFKKQKKEALEKVTADHQKIAHKLDIEDRLFRTSAQECFIKLKDHKNNFHEKPQVRTLNPTKPELGRVSKKVLDAKINVIRKKTKLNQWQNTNSALNWFRNLKDKKQLKFIIFDVEQFYPSIDEKLLKKTLEWSKQFVSFSEDEIEVIMAARRSVLYMDGEPWSKKGNKIFDVGMGSFDGAEICELVGLFLLSELSCLGLDLGIYRDDGLAVTNKSPRETEKAKKRMAAIFKKHNLKITVEANKKRVEFLDVYLDLDKEEHGPFLKPNDTPLYVNIGSNHPPKILENIPKGVNRRLSNISSTKEIFDKAAPTYQAALREAGYTYNLEYEEPSWDTTTTTQGRKNRKRKIIWFNPPFSKTVKTNVGARFLQLVAKHFPKENPLHKIFNKNTVKTSYRCTPNLGRKISAHNRKILEAEKGEGAEEPCVCTKFDCPVQGKCTQKGVVYNATITREDNIVDTYIGLSEPAFKERWSNHRSNFKTRNPKNATTLSKHIWDLDDKNIKYEIDWKIVSQAKAFNPVTGICHLCNREKFFILFKQEMASINERDEIAGPCQHKHNKLLKKS